MRQRGLFDVLETYIMRQSIALAEGNWMEIEFALHSAVNQIKQHYDLRMSLAIIVHKYIEISSFSVICVLNGL